MFLRYFIFGLVMILQCLTGVDLLYAQGTTPPPPPPITNCADTVPAGASMNCIQWSQQPAAQKSICSCTDLTEGLPEIVIKDSSGVACAKYESKLCKTLITPTGTTAFETYVSLGYVLLGWSMGVLSVIMIGLSAMEIALGGVTPDSVATGKKRLMGLVGATALYFLMGAILRTINPNFFI